MTHLESGTYPPGYVNRYAAPMPEPSNAKRQAILDGAARRRVGILAYIAARIAEGQAPSVREIAERTEVSERAVKVDLYALIDAGWLTRTPGIARGLNLTEEGLTFLATRDASTPRLAVVR